MLSLIHIYFVAVGAVDIKVIGADNQLPDSELPVREMLEQIVAKLGIPPVSYTHLRCV